MPLASLFALQWYGPAAGASVTSGVGETVAGIAGTGRLGEVTNGAATVPLAKATRLVNSPMLVNAAGAMPYALPKARARMGQIVTIGELSQDDVTGAVLEALVEDDVSLKQAIRLILAYVAGNATGLDTNPVFASLDGSKTRLAGTISSGTRTVTTRDPT